MNDIASSRKMGGLVSSSFSGGLVTLVGEAITSVEQILELIHIEGDPFFGKGEGVVPLQLQVLISVEGTVLRIDDPDFRDAHIPVVFQLAFETLQAVFGRENLKNGERRMGDDLLDGQAAVKHGDIGNAISGRCDL